MFNLGRGTGRSCSHGLRSDWLATRQRCHCCLRVPVDDAEEGSGWALGVAFALFPVAQGFDGDAEAFGEGGLAEAGAGADAADVGGGVGPCFGFVLGDMAGNVLFGGGVDFRPIDLLGRWGLGAVRVDDVDPAVDQSGANSGGLAHLSWPFRRAGVLDLVASLVRPDMAAWPSRSMAYASDSIPPQRPQSPFPKDRRGMGSDCLGCQAVCHGFWSLMMALRMVRSLRATAIRATILGFPAAMRRS